MKNFIARCVFALLLMCIADCCLAQSEQVTNISYQSATQFNAVVRKHFNDAPQIDTAEYLNFPVGYRYRFGKVSNPEEIIFVDYYLKEDTNTVDFVEVIGTQEKILRFYTTYFMPAAAGKRIGDIPYWTTKGSEKISIRMNQQGNLGKGNIQLGVITIKAAK